MLGAPTAQPVLDHLDTGGHEEREGRKHDQSRKHNVYVIAARRPHHHDTKPFLGAEELRNHDAEDGSADREPQPCNDIRHGVGHHDETRNVPFTGAKRAHHVDENAIGVAHPLIGVDQNRKQRSDKYDHDLRPHPEPEPKQQQRQKDEPRRGIEGGDEGVEHRIECTRAPEQDAERQAGCNR